MWSVAPKNDNSANFRILIMPPDLYSTFFFSFLEYNFATIRNILMVHGRIIEQVNVECHIQE